jgi:hypothetical protein
MTKKENNIREKILKGLDLTYHKLIKHKKDRNLTLVVSHDGIIIHMRAKDL